MTPFSQFIVQIKDDKAYLFFLHRGEVEDKWVLSPDSPLPEFMRLHPDIPVIVLMDTSDMQLRTETLPETSFLDLWRFYRHKKQEVHKSHRFYGFRMFRDSSEGKGWVSQTLVLDQAVEPWLNFLHSIPHPIKACLCMAYEGYDILKRLRNRSRWQVLLTLHEGGSIRISLYQESHLESTSVEPLDLNQTQQEISKSLHNLLEKSCAELFHAHPPVKHMLNVFAVVDDDMRRLLKPSILKPYQFHVLTPFQVATRMGLSGKVAFRFSDTLFIRNLNKKWMFKFPLNFSEIQIDSRASLRKKIFLGGAGVIVSLLTWVGIEFLTSQQHIETATTERVIPTPEDIHLAGIVYVDESHWTIWVGGKAYRAGDPIDFQGVDLISVSKEGIVLNHSGRYIHLYPQQTYVAKEGVVREKRRLRRHR